jgi:hypothetical protein
VTINFHVCVLWSKLLLGQHFEKFGYYSGFFTYICDCCPCLKLWRFFVVGLLVAVSAIEFVIVNIDM